MTDRQFDKTKYRGVDIYAYPGDHGSQKRYCVFCWESRKRCRVLKERHKGWQTGPRALDEKPMSKGYEMFCPTCDYRGDCDT